MSMCASDFKCHMKTCPFEDMPVALIILCYFQVLLKIRQTNSIPIQRTEE